MHIQSNASQLSSFPQITALRLEDVTRKLPKDALKDVTAHLSSLSTDEFNSLPRAYVKRRVNNISRYREELQKLAEAIMKRIK